jgi:hypothetical protein
MDRVNTTDSQILIAEYARTASEAAFRDLVSRYIDLVYTTALRSVGGDTHLAEDVAQTVFIHLAQKAKYLPTDVLLGGWLHRDACYVLKRQIAEMSKIKAQAARPAQPVEQPVDSADAEQQKALMKQQTIAKMGYAKNWIWAFANYADKNQGLLPTSFDQAASLLPDTANDETLVATNHFEIKYQGSLKAIAAPATTIVLRESQSHQSPSGGWNRIYAFADGHCEAHRENEDNFQDWEAKHMASPAN